MKIIVLESTNPTFNLAAEEYFLKQTADSVFMLWRNDRSVIVGRNQNTHAEIDSNFVRENNIKVVRRITGGGAVFHDLGNVNYTFVTRSKEQFNNYEHFARPIILALKKLSVDATLSGRNDLLIGDKKFSGNAQTSYANSVMHHGTLMFGADLSSLAGALKVNPLKIKSKGIASVKSRVTNIKEHLKNNISIEEFINTVKQTVFEYYSDAKEYSLTQEDIENIKKLQQNKYDTYEWNYGFAQQYTVANEARFLGGTVTLSLTIDKNIIAAVKIFGDFFGSNDITVLENMLLGVDYNENAIKAVLDKIEIEDYMHNITKAEFVGLFF